LPIIKTKKWFVLILFIFYPNLNPNALAAVQVLYLVSRALDIVLYGALLAVAM